MVGRGCGESRWLVVALGRDTRLLLDPGSANETVQGRASRCSWALRRAPARRRSSLLACAADFGAATAAPSPEVTVLFFLPVFFFCFFLADWSSPHWFHASSSPRVLGAALFMALATRNLNCKNFNLWKGTFLWFTYNQLGLRPSCLCLVALGSRHSGRSREVKGRRHRSRSLKMVSTRRSTPGRRSKSPAAGRRKSKSPAPKQARRKSPAKRTKKKSLAKKKSPKKKADEEKGSSTSADGETEEFKQLKRDLLRYKYVSPNLSLTERLFLNDFWALFPTYVSVALARLEFRSSPALARSCLLSPPPPPPSVPVD